MRRKDFPPLSTRFSVLASGSSGNASLLQSGGFGLLIDLGLSPRMLAARLAAVGATWNAIHAVVLSHTHGDHWNDRSLASLLQYKIRLHCHRDHQRTLETQSENFVLLRAAGLVAHYDDAEFSPTPALRCRPLLVSHDSEPTFGFRLDARDEPWSLGYMSDLGCWTPELVEAMVGVDVLALEFNHDVAMEKRSRRPDYLIQRVLGDYGHLSNGQAADFFSAVVERGGSGPEHLVQLHLSRECNRPELAQAAAQRVARRMSPATRIHTASQHCAGPMLTPAGAPLVAQAMLPGMEA